MEESLVLPLFPMSMVMVPYCSMVIKETDKTIFDLLKYCIENKEPFASIYGDHEEGLRDIGCICEISEYQINQNEIVCSFNASRRISKESIVSIKNGREEVIFNGKTIYFELDEPMDDILFSFIKGAIFPDENSNIRSDIRDEVLQKFNEIAKVEPDVFNTLMDLNKQELTEGISFFILDNLVGSESREDNLIRYEFLAKRSENQRFRLLKKILAGNGQSN